MGYSTDFEGSFHCYRPESPQLRVFLEAVRAKESAALEALADWLMDEGDSRGEEIARSVQASPVNMKAFWKLFGLTPMHAAYLHKFRRTRRMQRDASRAEGLPDPVRQAVGLPIGVEAGYFVGGLGYHGQDGDESVIEYNRPPTGQPGLWCQWVPNEDHTGIEWSGAEKFYDYIDWLEYLLVHFLGPWGYVVNGTVTWQGQEEQDTGTIIVARNAVKTVSQSRRHRPKP